MKATIDERGQVIIPKVLRRKLGIKPGTYLDFREENGRLIVEKISNEDQVERVYGCPRLGKGTNAFLRDWRWTRTP